MWLCYHLKWCPVSLDHYTIPIALKCSICGGLIHQTSISYDHIIRKQDGGLGSASNASLMHPYCNTTVKN
ncbi:HNH endonuclease [Marinomonas gallaica]|uniref:HNH endonuclease n=1 Tax=Marinomonas gallaica TaxID=1806667 RepID=UPI0009EE7CC1